MTSNMAEHPKGSSICPRILAKIAGDGSGGISVQETARAVDTAGLPAAQRRTNANFPPRRKVGRFCAMTVQNWVKSRGDLRTLDMT
jgi:hypothetical protein